MPGIVDAVDYKKEWSSDLDPKILTFLRRNRPPVEITQPPSLDMYTVLLKTRRRLLHELGSEKRKTVEFFLSRSNGRRRADRVRRQRPANAQVFRLPRNVEQSGGRVRDGERQSRRLLAGGRRPTGKELDTNLRQAERHRSSIGR
ncbi:uncharacterized protein [Oscarella lobularis]|uniref:uncharacterized protein n=1 Tax=Oscarella lobularis TaxID=121494 RepID=UPI0033138CC5